MFFHVRARKKICGARKDTISAAISSAVYVLSKSAVWHLQRCPPWPYILRRSGNVARNQASSRSRRAFVVQCRRTPPVDMQLTRFCLRRLRRAKRPCRTLRAPTAVRRRQISFSRRTAAWRAPCCATMRGGPRPDLQGLICNTQMRTRCSEATCATLRFPQLRVRVSLLCARVPAAYYRRLRLQEGCSHRRILYTHRCIFQPRASQAGIPTTTWISGVRKWPLDSIPVRRSIYAAARRHPPQECPC